MRFALVALIVAAVALGVYALSREKTNLAEDLPTPSSAIVAEVGSAAPTATQAPTATLDPQQRLRLAGSLQQAALSNGVIKLALPDSLNTAMAVDQSKPLASGEQDLLLSATGHDQILIPAPIAGVVETAEALNRGPIKWVQIRQGKWLVSLFSPGSLLVRAGQAIQLGEPLLSVNYDPDSAAQQLFETPRGNLTPPKGNVVVIAVQDTTVGPGRGFQALTLQDSVIRDDAGAAILIPVVGSVQRQ